MSWLDDLRQASYRGVPFQVDTVSHEAGDNIVLREYPFQDLPTVLRMGEAAEEIKFSAYVIGRDYTRARDALREALKGDGELVHPTVGTLRVVVAGKYRISEAPTAEGGMARFDLAFVRAQPRRYPAGPQASSATATAQAKAAKKAARERFGAQWGLDGQPGWAAEQMVDRVKKSLETVWGPLSDASKTLGDFNAEVIGSYAALRTGLDYLMRTPRQLADHVATLFELPGELTNAAARDLQKAFAWVFDVQQRIADTGFEVKVMPAIGAGLVMFGNVHASALAVDSVGRRQLAQGHAASDALFETLATAAWVEALRWVELTSYDDAMALRRTVHAQCVRLLKAGSAAAAPSTLPGSNWHDAVAGMMAAALAELQERSRTLVRLTSFTPQQWMPVWLVSYQLYGTAQYADEILGLNPHIEHPLLVPPGQALRVAQH
jgi:prophage DNA circulation protein